MRGKAQDAQFWSVDGDVDSFARAISHYLEINQRWNSPKFLFGESYGTTRAAAMAYELHIQDVDLSKRTSASSTTSRGTRPTRTGMRFII